MTESQSHTAHEELRRLAHYLVDSSRIEPASLSCEQRAVGSLYAQIAHKVFHTVSWIPLVVNDSQLARLQVTRPIRSMSADVYHHGAIRLRGDVQTDKPKLVLGCGNGDQKIMCYNPHLGEDTINVQVEMNPSVLGLFGITDTEGGKTPILAENHYNTVFDEGVLTLAASSPKKLDDFWHEVYRILRPGGFFIYMGGWGTPPA